MSNRMYKTLPSALRNGQGRGRGQGRDQNQQQNLFGLHLNLGFSNLISGGMNFLGQLRRKTPQSSTATTPVHANKSLAVRSLSSSSSSSDPFFDADDEHIELTSFHTIPEAGEGQTGKGHQFNTLGTFNPTWCDLCGELIWGLYDTGASRCVHCNYTCHVKCQKKVRLNCSKLTEETQPKKADHVIDPNEVVVVDEDDQDTLQNLSTLKSELIEADFKTAKEDDDDDDDDDFKTLKDIDNLEYDADHSNIISSTIFDNETDLKSILCKYNEQSHLGQETIFEEGVFRGFVRVKLNLQRPINVISGTRVPSVYNLTKDDTLLDKTLTTFYLPPDSFKSVHLTSQATTRDVIRTLLDKFRVADNPHKYALYEQTLSAMDQPEDRRTLSRLRMRKMKDEERPLLLALIWCKEELTNDKCFVLQENDPGEISWETFSMPELKNFLLILDREEAWYKKKIHEKYEAIHHYMQVLANEKKETKDTSTAI